jgi:hypothetical protein
MAIGSVSTQAESTPGDDLSQTMEAALEAFEPGFELSRDQPVQGPLACDGSIRQALLSRLAAQPASGELLTCQREELYE